MDKFEELMARRELLIADWRERVAEAKAQGLTKEDFYATGPILQKDGKLVMFVSARHGRIFDLELATGETEVQRVG